MFGNANDKNSVVSKNRTENPNRLFHVLEELHTISNISYLAKVRNTDKLSAEVEEHEEMKKVEKV